MNTSPRIQLLTLANGERLIRLEDDESGLSLERKLNPQLPVVGQKAKMLRLFEEMLRSELAAA